MRKDGGQAFPMHDLVWKGMTLRDFFAAAALQGALSTGGVDTSDLGRFAEELYRMADAMLQEREKQ